MPRQTPDDNRDDAVSRHWSQDTAYTDPQRYGYAGGCQGWRWRYSDAYRSSHGRSRQWRPSPYKIRIWNDGTPRRRPQSQQRKSSRVQDIGSSQSS